MTNTSDSILDNTPSHLELINNEINNENSLVKNTLYAGGFITGIGLYIVVIFITIWALLGIAAWIMSIYCFKYGVNKNSIIGLILAFIPFILGPLYWIYYIWNPNYCKNPILPYVTPLQNANK